MSSPFVVAVQENSPASRCGLLPGDELVSIANVKPRDVIEYQILVEEPSFEIEVMRGGLTFSVSIEKLAGEPLGVEVSSALFDRVRTCDNHCEFCFIYQLPKGMRKSLYMKDDDYRLSFLYGNFTTLTRFTEWDLERVVTERLSPLFVSIHATDPALRTRMLRNPRGAISLRWLKAMLEEGIEVHGQIVVCPGLNDSQNLHRTLSGILAEYSELETVAVVPLGISKFLKEPAMREHTEQEAQDVVDIVEHFQGVFMELLGRRMVYCSDEYYLLAGREFPEHTSYDGFPQHENGIGMARAFERAFFGDKKAQIGIKPGFFSWVDGAPAQGYRAKRTTETIHIRSKGRSGGRIGVLTSSYGKRVLAPLIAAAGAEHVRLIEVRNDFFGGNIAVAGLITGVDLCRTLMAEPDGDRYLLPDVCLTEGRFLDGLRLDDLPKAVEVIPTDGASFRAAIATENLKLTGVVR